jgi:hypothetical protein
MSLEGNNWGDRFGNKGVAALAAFMSTYNMVDQAFTFGDGADPATTGTGDCTINGVYIPSLTAEADADWSSILAADLVEGDARGHVIPTAYSQYFAAFANAAGRLMILQAGDMALDGSEELKIPWFDPTTWCCIALFHINSTGFTCGTTATGTMETEYAVIGPVLPHPDNLQI